MKFEKNIYSHLDGNYHSKISLSRLLSRLKIDKKAYYDEFMKKDGEGLCANCGKETKFDKMSYYKFCSTYCNAQINNNLKMLHDELDNNPELKKETYDKMVKSREKADPNMQKAMAKRKETFVEKYNMTESEFRTAQWKNFYDGMNEDQKFEYFTKLISNRSSAGTYKYKEYDMGNRTVLVQGYEPYVLDSLLKYYSPEEMTVGSENDFIFYKDKANKKRRYLTDIIFKKTRLLIEVKSSYTLEKNYDVTFRKMQASLDEGFTPILVVWDKNNAEQLEKILIETISSQALLREGRFNDYPFIGVGFK